MNESNRLEREYQDNVLAILEAHGASKELKEEALLQITEHMEDCRADGADFRQSLGAPDDVARAYLTAAGMAPEGAATRMSGGAQAARASKNGGRFNWRAGLAAATLLLLYYSIAQIFAAMFLTTSLVQPNADFSFNLWFRIAEMPWYNMQLLLSNAGIAIVLTLVTLFLYRKLYAKRSSHE